MFNNGTQKNESLSDNLIVTPETVTTAGAISYWRLSGEVSLARLATAWKTEGLSDETLPSEPSDEVTFRRAVKDLEERRVLIRPLARRGAWAVVHEFVTEGDNKPRYSIRVAIKFNDGAFEFEAVDADAGERDYLKDKILSTFEDRRGILTQQDIAVWLVKVVEKLGAVSLRDSGGVYFVPRFEVETWRKIVRAVEASSSSKVFSIPAMKNSEAIEAISEALLAEGDKLADSVMEELMAPGEEALGDRALASRANTCETQLAKIASYESLLGVKLDIVRERMAKLSASIAASVLLIGQQGDAQV